jgi:hypothetical protein
MSGEEKESLKVEFAFGQKAQEVLDNQAYRYALTAMRGEIFEKLETSDISGDNGEILEQVRTLQNLSKMQDKLETIMVNGSFAEKNLEAEEVNQKRFKR